MSGEKKVRLIPLEELVRLFARYAFTGYTVSDQMMLRVTRNADFDTAIDDTDLERDFTEIMKQRVESRDVYKRQRRSSCRCPSCSRTGWRCA